MRSLLCALLVVTCANPLVGASFGSTQAGDSLTLVRRSLLADVVEVSSPDVPRDGACAADIVLHCKHLLTTQVNAAAQAIRAGAKATAAAAAASGSGVAATKTAQRTAASAGSAVAGKAAAKATDSASATAAAGAGKKTATGAAAAADVQTGEGNLDLKSTGGVTGGSTQTAAAVSVAGAAKASQTAEGNSGAAKATEKAAEGTVAGAAKATEKAEEGTVAGAAVATETAAEGTVAGAAVATQTAEVGTAKEQNAGVAAAGTATADGGAIVGKAAAAGTSQQQQTQQGAAARRRRHLLAGEVDVEAVASKVGGRAVAAELNTAAAHNDDLARTLELLGLSSGLSSLAMASASAPIAKCLLSSMHASEMSINPNIPHVSNECKAEVRSVLVQRASHLQYDPPLLAACSYDIVTHCEDAGPDSAAVLRCLKAAKPQLLALCRAAVTARQAAAAEDLSLDPDLQRHCGEERDALCLEAGWGEGAAQECLLGHLRGSLPQVFSEAIFPAAGVGAGRGRKAVAGGRGGSGSAPAVELSSNCSAALVWRLIEEGEDIRLNYRLSAACAGDKQVLCRDVRPGGAAVLRCLERHLDSPDMSEECRDALGEVRQLRSLDVRLDHTFTSSCAGDVRSLCEEGLAEQLKAGPEEVPFGLSTPFECLRGRLEMVRDATCRRHMYESLVSAYMDNQLDSGLMRGCHQEVALLCAAHPPRALECLQDKIDKFTREDSPAVLKGKISEQCMAVVLDRRSQAATDVAFVPDLMEACAREHASLCSAPGIEGVRALDCLADKRNSPGFSERCGEALREYLVEAARDIRTMAGLSKDCGEEIRTMCKGIQPGEGRVISCLRDRRADISSEQCRSQVMRLLGFMVEDHRVDVRLTEACTGDVQKYCGGVEAGDGQVHDCLRRSADHLSPECRAAEEEVERLEHEDVRLNPKLMRECPLAISGFCSDVPPGDARVISCLQANMDKGHFPPGCRLALRQLTDRAAVKYSLNFRLRQECDDDVERLCPEAVDELGTGRQSVTGRGGAHDEETALACLARQSVQLAPSCRSELQALVKLSLNRYRVGMPLTSQCDGDVLQRCQVDKVAAPFLQTGYVMGCLAKHAAQLHKPCWELVSTMDEGQFRRAAAAETHAVQRGGDLALRLDEKMLEKVAADLRRDLEPRIYSNVHEQVNRKAVLVAHNVTGALVGSLLPKVTALMYSTTWVLTFTVVSLAVLMVVMRNFIAKGANLLVVRKDGRV